MFAERKTDVLINNIEIFDINPTISSSFRLQGQQQKTVVDGGGKEKLTPSPNDFVYGRGSWQGQKNNIQGEENQKKNNSYPIISTSNFLVAPQGSNQEIVDGGGK